MADTDKPFACSSSGCNMSFTNEDQLTVHKKKHDMMLNLGTASKNAGFAADQTPTPTRFFRNCEEVGLFQDLQNVNPFEETFRRAVESGNTGTLSVPEAGITDDTLHTPHIFPQIADVLSASNPMLSESSVTECSSSISITEKSTEERNPIDSEVCSSVKLTGSDEPDLMKEKLAEKNETLAETIIDEVTNTPMQSKVLEEQTSPQLSINGEEVQLLLKTADGKLMQLSAISICDSTGANTVQQSKPQTVVIKTQPPLQCSTKVDSKKSEETTLSLAKMKLKEALAKNANLQNGKSNDVSGKSEQRLRKENHKTIDLTKKRDILERNRASSMRARAKRKAWIQQLERTVTNVNEANVALQMEIKVLRTEVAKLKALLLAHKDCSVTKAMQKGNSVIVGPKIISLNSDVVTNSTPLGISVKRVSSEVPIVPKKKISLTTSKNPVIFPKVDCNTNVPIGNSTLIKTIPALKIMGMGQLLTEKDETKILIVQNSARKIESSSKQIIQTNRNYEMEQTVPKNAEA